MKMNNDFYPKISAGLRINILHTDPDFVVLEKPGNLLSVPGRNPLHQNCVTEQVKAQFQDCIDHPAVHRLDMATSGLMVVALSKEAQRSLSMQFQEKLVQKTYIAMLGGCVDLDSGIIKLPFRLDPDNRPYQVYDEVQGKWGETHFEVLSKNQGQTRIKFTPVTGRTHQLRLHSAHPKGLGIPIIGDALYGTGKDGDMMYLHAATLEFSHPITEMKLQFKSSPPF
jgi:tRNA pseudouridine32 synthase/23S rRNA pseudouridine746 synthase